MYSIVDDVNKKPCTAWQPDTTTKNCRNCNTTFGYWIRKHHCRYCGYIFCDKCSSFRIRFPDYLKTNIIKRIIPDIRSIAHSAWYVGDYKHRVCEKCYVIVQELHRVDELVKILDKLPLNIRDIKVMACVCKDWKKYADYYITHYKKALFAVNDFTLVERRILWNNRDLFAGHDYLLRQMILSLDFYKYHEAARLLGMPKKHSCKNLGCSMSCSGNTKHLSRENMLLLCSHSVLSKDILQFALSNITLDKSMVPFLIETGLKSPFNDVHEWLIFHCRDLVIANEVYWYIGVHSPVQDTTDYFNNSYGVSPGTRESVIPMNRKDTMAEVKKNKYNMLFMRWKQTVSEEHKIRIAKAAKLITFLEKLYTKNRGDIAQLKKWEIVLAHDIEQTDLKFKEAVYKNSASTPILMTFMRKKKKTLHFFDDMENETEIIRVLYKPSDITKDQTCMNMISFMDDIFKVEIGDFQVVKYRILPTSPVGGLIEIVEAETLYSIYKKNQSILNHIIDNNPDRSTKNIRDIFIKSAAAYTCFAYILGLSDRHPDNIMVTKCGKLFEIDYEFLLGMDPKKITELRISEDMIEVMGGHCSNNFEQFKKYCSDIIYDTLRKHITIIVAMLSFLPYDENQIRDFLLSKLMPGNENRHASMVFYKSLSSSYKYKIIDLLHSSSKDGALKSLDDLKNYLFSYFL